VSPEIRSSTEVPGGHGTSTGPSTGRTPGRSQRWATGMSRSGPHPSSTTDRVGTPRRGGGPQGIVAAGFCDAGPRIGQPQTSLTAAHDIWFVIERQRLCRTGPDLRSPHQHPPIAPPGGGQHSVARPGQVTGARTAQFVEASSKAVGTTFPESYVTGWTRSGGPSYGQ